MRLCLPAAGLGQAVTAQAPAIDTIIIRTHNVFTREQTEGNFAFRLMNAIHAITKETTVRAELLFGPGEPYDSVKAAESARNLRARELFVSVDIDTTRIDGRLAVIVDTRDAWTLKPKFSFTVATDGTLTGQLGLSEINLFGTGNLAHFAYVKEAERHGPQLTADFRRLFGTELGAAGSVTFWSDGTDGFWRLGDPWTSSLDPRSIMTDGFWRLGDPWTSSLDPRSIMYDGEASDRRVLQYRVDDFGRDTTTYDRNAFINRLTVANAQIKEPTRYLRFGAKAEVRQEQYVLRQDVAPAAEDSLYGEFGLFGEYSETRFQQLRYFNGFGEEDVDVSSRVKLTLNLAASGLGYSRTGIGPHVEAALGTRGANAFAVSTLKGSGLFTDAGLDSGRVVLDVTLGFKLWPRHSTTLYVTAGAQENPPPGQEFNLGFETPPRSWEPFAFVGTRMVWGTLEHRWYKWEALFDLVSVGLAAFMDYGGAWYPDQDPRFGGNAGIGLRMGGALSAAARTGRLDFGCRFGQGADFGDPCVVTFGAGFVFPWNPAAADLVQKKY
jgi:hypothetical protein